MSQLTDKKPRRAKRDTIESAVKYVDKERATEKIVDYSTLPEETSKRPVSSFTEFWSMTTMSKQVASEVWAEKTAKRLVQWAEDQSTGSAFKMNEFYRLLGMDHDTYVDLEEKYPILKKARKYAVKVLGDKREAGLLWRSLEPGSTSFMMPLYDDNWKAMVEWRSSLKQSEGQAGATRMQYVVVPEMPKSDLVPTNVVKERSNGIEQDRDNDNRDDQAGKISTESENKE